MNTETQATENTEQTPQLPTITEERLLAAAFIGQAISKDGLFPHVIVTTGFRYGGIVRTMIAWAPQGQLTPTSVALAMGIPYDPQQGDFIHIEMIANVNALMGIPETPVLNVVRSTYQVLQGAAPAAEEAPAEVISSEETTVPKTDEVEPKPVEAEPKPDEEEPKTIEAEPKIIEAEPKPDEAVESTEAPQDSGVASPEEHPPVVQHVPV